MRSVASPNSPKRYCLLDARASDAITLMRRCLFPILAYSILFLAPRTARSSKAHATLEDLKKLEIICFVPSYLPKGFRLKSVTITYDEPSPDEGSVGRFPLYYLEYSNSPSRTGSQASFTIDSAREGIGERNIMGTDDSEDAEIKSPFGPMYL